VSTRLSINLPNDLAAAVREHDINVSALARAAVEQALGVTASCPHRMVECVVCRARMKRPEQLESTPDEP
jgi:hypothetical protein